MTALLAARIKAAAAFVAAAVVSYVATAIIDGTVWTAHGAEVAAATAVLTALGVERSPRNKEKTRRATGKPSVVHTISIEADTTQFVAALKEVTARAKEAQRAVDAVKPRRLPRSKDAGHVGLVPIMVVAILVLVILLAVGAFR